MPKNETNPSATSSVGMQNGTDESESKIFLPQKERFAVKNAAAIPTKSAITVEQIACKTVNALIYRRFCTVRTYLRIETTSSTASESTSESTETVFVAWLAAFS